MTSDVERHNELRRNDTDTQDDLSQLPAGTVAATNVEVVKDSPPEMTYVGLKNQGATCYMNTMLQALFHLPAFRRIVYEMNVTGKEDIKKSIPLALQRLFGLLQFGKEAVSTRELTSSFNWDSGQTYVQHDTQEFCRVIMDNLEKKMKNTPLENRIPNLFRGTVRSFIRCTHVPYRSERTQDFYDILMPVQNISTLEQSFEAYMKPERLDGDNQYGTSDYGKQDATMGMEIIEFPPVLHLHLGRFSYSYETGKNVKIHSEFEFPMHIDLERFLAPDANRDKSHVYDLYGVLVHDGGVSGGHYYGFLRTSEDKQWYKFNDSTVSKVCEREAMDDNFGGTSRNYSGSKSAYVLIYVRREDAHDMFKPIPNETLPQHIRDYTAGDKAAAPVKMMDLSCLRIDAVLRRNVEHAVGFVCPALTKTVVISDNDTYANVYDKVGTAHGLDPTRIRVYVGSDGPKQPLERSSQLCKQKVTQYVSLYVQELKEGDSVDIPKGYVVVFLKFFCRTWESPFQYGGPMLYKENSTVGTFLDEIRTVMGITDDVSVSFKLFEESKTAMTELKSVNRDEALKFGWMAPSHGMIIVIQVDCDNHVPSMTFLPAGVENSTCEGVDLGKLGTEYENLPIVKYADFVSRDTLRSVMEYYESIMSPELVIGVCSFDDPKPLAVLRVPGEACSKNVAEFLSVALSIDVDPVRQKLVLYAGDYMKPGKPGQLIRDCTFRTKYGFAQEKPIVYVRVVSVDAGTESLSADRMTITHNVGGAETKMSVDKMKCDTQYKAFHEKYIQDILKGVTEPVRIISIPSYGGDIVELKMDSPMTNVVSIRVEIIPEDQRDLAEGEHIISVVMVEKSSWSSTFTGDVRFLKVHKDFTLADIRAKLLPTLKVTDEVMKNAVFAIHKPGFYYDSALALRDTWKIGDNVKLVLVWNAKSATAKFGRTQSQSIIIDN